MTRGWRDNARAMPPNAVILNDSDIELLAIHCLTILRFVGAGSRDVLKSVDSIGHPADPLQGDKCVMDVILYCHFEVVQRRAAVDFALLLQSFDEDSRTHME